jgi:hypothetical protein
MAAEDSATGDQALQALPLVVASGEQAEARPRLRFKVPKIVDYLIVAIFMYFVL